MDEEKALELLEATHALLDCVSMFLKAEELELVMTSFFKAISEEERNMRGTKLKTARRLREEVDKLKEVYGALSFTDEKAQALS